MGRAKGEYDQELAAQIKKRRDTVKKIISSLKEKYLLETEEDYQRDIAELRPKVQMLFSLVVAFSQRFAEKKRERNLLDFHDLEHFALKLLIIEQDGGFLTTPLALELRTRYDEIMVDEYQDTNATQDMLFFALSQNGQNLFTVGDVKQSIYGFRQAEPKLFLRRQAAAKTYDGSYGPSKIFLSHNFRSRKNILDAVNFLFSQLMTEQTGGISYDETQRLVCGKEPENPGPAVRFDILDTAGQELTADEVEARYVAKLIREKLDSGETLKEKGRPLQPGDFCILLRSPKGSAVQYEKALAKAGIESYCRFTGNYFLSREIMTMLSFLRVIDNPLQDIPMLALLMSPFFSFLRMIFPICARHLRSVICIPLLSPPPKEERKNAFF